MFFKNPKLRYKKLLIIIIPLLIVCIVCAFFAYTSFSSVKLDSGTSSRDINEMDYHLRSNATDYQKELFSELSKLVKDNADDLVIAKSVVKNYIADTYTWNNKKGQWDVGGICYVYSPMKNNFYYKARDEFYGLLNKYIDDYGSTHLLEVSNIETLNSSKADDKFEVDGNQYDCFIIDCKWQYTEDSKFANQIDNAMMFNVIKNNDGRFEIVVNYESGK